jgi:hypothetical protein
MLQGRKSRSETREQKNLTVAIHSAAQANIIRASRARECLRYVESNSDKGAISRQ